MKRFSLIRPHSHFARRPSREGEKSRAARLFLLPAFVFAFLPACSCDDRVDYTDYISEKRYDILIAATDTIGGETAAESGNGQKIALCVYASERENPYAADGSKRTMSAITEFYLTAPTDVQGYDIAFTAGGNEYGGDMVFDNIRTQYYYSCALDLHGTDALDVTVTETKNSGSQEKKYLFRAESIRTADTLTPEQALDFLVRNEKDLFDAHTDKNTFDGEIYLRLIYGEAPYYYIGVIDKTGRTEAFLLDSTDGKLLAKKNM